MARRARRDSRPLDLGHHLLFGEAGAGHRPGGTGGDARAAALAERRLTSLTSAVLVEADRAERAEVRCRSGSRSSAPRRPRARTGSSEISPAAGCGRGFGPRRPPPGRRSTGCPSGPGAQPATKTPSVIVATGSSFGCFSMTQPSELHEMPKCGATSRRRGCGSRPADRIDHVDRDAALAAGERVLDLDDQPAFFGRPRRVGASR